MLTTQDAPASQTVTKKSCDFCGFARNNADLINAAPEMYAVLSEIDSVGFFDWGTFGPKIAAALAKAEGRP
jgi:hypothetical protein